jgi:coproporphyrinogen III oxidase
VDKPKEVINSEKIILEMQSKVLTLFHALSDKNFNDEVNWVRPAGGGGKSITIINKHIEKAACNFSSITDVKLPSASLASKINNKGIGRFYATGLSVISHPVNPKVPSSHLNIRIFKIFDKKGNLSDFWCGGGYDLTPYIPFKADTNLWHKNAKNCLDGFNKNFYRKFSKNCDEYFFLPHRNEKRGIGGIFFDSLKLKNIDKCLELLISVVESYISSYQEICLKRMEMPYSDDEKIFQEYRRSRYVEFNLLHDRGTKFGIESGGRADSILASLPPSVLWPPFKDQNMKTLERKLLKHLNQNWNIK